MQNKEYERQIALYNFLINLAETDEEVNDIKELVSQE